MCQLYVGFHVYIVLNHIKYVFVHFFCLLLLSMKLFVWHVTYFDFSEGILCTSFCANFLSIWLPVLVWPLTFASNSDCDIIFTPVIFQWLVQSQSESNYCRWFGVNLLVSCLFVFVFERSVFHIIMMLCPLLFIFEGSRVSLIRRS